MVLALDALYIHDRARETDSKSKGGIIVGDHFCHLAPWRTFSRSQQPLVPAKEPDREPPKTPPPNAFTEICRDGPTYMQPRDIGLTTPRTPVKNGVFPQRTEDDNVGGMTAAEQKIVEKKMRLIYVANMQISNEAVQDFIAPNMPSNDPRMALLQKQAVELQGRLQKQMWGSKALVKQAFDIAREHDQKARADPARKLKPFAELSSREQDALFLRKFNMQIARDILHCVRQAVDISGYMRLCLSLISLHQARQ